MIGYYVHHHGRGHLSRARAIAGALADRVTVLSSFPRPDDWSGGWVDLPSDVGDAARNPTAHGRLHWAPVGITGLRERMSAISSWIDAAAPAVVVVDVSVEVAALVRLHGIPVVSVVLPGHRADAAHRLGFALSDALLAAWPPGVPGMLTGVPRAVLGAVHTVGAISGGTPGPGDREPVVPSRVVLLSGAGGDVFTSDAVAAARRESPAWEWIHLGGHGRWVADPASLIASAEVVVTHAGQNALAEVAAARRPAVLLPQARPFDEQVTTARALASSSAPVVVRDRWPTGGWRSLLDTARALDGDDWSFWNDHGGARRAAAVITAARLSRDGSAR